MTHIPGTLYPFGGRPHTPDLCSFRSGVRSNGRHRTVLCYAAATQRMVGPDGTPAVTLTAEGPMPHHFCDKHQRAVAPSYRGARWSRIEVVAS